MIKKTKDGWRVVSHISGKNMGTYDTKKEAQERLKQILRFTYKA